MPNAILHEIYDGARTHSYTAGSVNTLIERIEVHRIGLPTTRDYLTEFLGRVPRENRVE